MLRKTFLFIVFPFVVIIVAVILAAQLFSSPARFTLKNSDSEPVKVVAHWRDKTRNIGQISPDTATEFFVEDESEMAFEITRANGTAVIVGNIAFRPDTSTRVEITRSSVQITSDIQ